MFFSSELFSTALEVHQNTKTRLFLPGKEQDKQDKLNIFEEYISARNLVYISKYHQRALVLDREGTDSIEARLAKDDNFPPSVKNKNDVSTLTGDTRELTAKLYATNKSKKVASVYAVTVSTFTEKLENNGA